MAQVLAVFCTGIPGNKKKFQLACLCLQPEVAQQRAVQNDHFGMLLKPYKIVKHVENQRRLLMRLCITSLTLDRAEEGSND